MEQGTFTWREVAIKLSPWVLVAAMWWAIIWAACKAIDWSLS